MHARHKRKQRAHEEGLCWNVAVVVLLLNSSPVAWRMAETSWVVRAGAGAGWRAALTPSRVPPVLFPLPGRLEHSFNAGSLVVLFPPKDKLNGSWDRLWTAVGMDLAFIMT